MLPALIISMGYASKQQTEILGFAVLDPGSNTAQTSGAPRPITKWLQVAKQDRQCNPICSPIPES